VSLLLNTFAVLADMGIVGLFDRLNGSIFHNDDFPDELNQRFHDYMLNGKYLRGYRDENKWDQSVYDQARATTNFGALPIRVFTANKRYNSNDSNPKWITLQKEIAALSTNSKHLLLDGHHNSIYTKKENADVICQEIMEVVKELDK